MPKTPGKPPGKTPNNSPRRTPNRPRPRSRRHGENNNIVFPSEAVRPKFIKSYDENDHRHYRDYRQFVLPYYQPVYTYSYESWMSRFQSTIQDVNINYPMYPTTMDMERMQNFILSLPDLIPCHSSLCKAYVTNHIERNRDNLDALTSNRNYLHEFLRDFYMDLKQKFGHELYEDSYYHGIV
jgi:hypothetical protein